MLEFAASENREIALRAVRLNLEVYAVVSSLFSPHFSACCEF